MEGASTTGARGAIGNAAGGLGAVVEDMVQVRPAMFAMDFHAAHAMGKVDFFLNRRVL